MVDSESGIVGTVRAIRLERISLKNGAAGQIKKLRCPGSQPWRAWIEITQYPNAIGTQLARMLSLLKLVKTKIHLALKLNQINSY